MSVALSIAFTGLCALVADGDGTPAKVLLIDAQGVGAVRGMTFPEHLPTLAVNLSELANAETSGPDRVIVTSESQIGLWPLAGTEVRIKTQGDVATGVKLFEPARGESSWPNAPRDFNDAASWRDLRYVTEMRAITGDGRIDASLLGEGEGASDRLPPSIASRITLDAGLLLGGLPTVEKHRADIFEFRSQGSEPAWRQALTDTIQWTLQTDAAAVVVEIVSIDGGPIRRLLFSARTTPHRLFVSNLPVENALGGDHHHAMSEEELTALHFGAFYALLKAPAAVMTLPQPWRAAESRRGTGGNRPSTCPVVRFTRH